MINPEQFLLNMVFFMFGSLFGLYIAFRLLEWFGGEE